MKKTLTVDGKKFTGKQIAAMFDESNMTHGGDYIIDLNGYRFYGIYRQHQDAYFAPHCDKSDANCISLASIERYGTWNYVDWLYL